MARATRSAEFTTCGRPHTYTPLILLPYPYPLVARHSHGCRPEERRTPQTVNIRNPLLPAGTAEMCDQQARNVFLEFRREYCIYSATAMMVRYLSHDDSHASSLCTCALETLLVLIPPLFHPRCAHSFPLKGMSTSCRLCKSLNFFIFFLWLQFACPS